ncbi:MAG: phosphodiester glycosidase family protein [Opitutaceae bacterium]
MPKRILKTLLLAAVCILLQPLSAEESFKISTARPSTLLHVVKFSASENIGFEFVDGGGDRKRYHANQHFDRAEHLLLINGGYFDGNLQLVGYFKVGKQVVSAEFSRKLSGCVVLDAEGALQLVPTAEVADNAHAILQTGPFIIDPGGKVGIYSETGLPAKRTVLETTTDDEVLVISATEVTLFQLARQLKQHLPTIDRALNLDGGPSTAFIYNDIKVENRNPVRNFLRKRRIKDVPNTN